MAAAMRLSRQRGSVCARAVREGHGPLGGRGGGQQAGDGDNDDERGAATQGRGAVARQDGGAGGVREGHRPWCARRLRRRRGEWRGQPDDGCSRSPYRHQEQYTMQSLAPVRCC